MCYRIFLLLPVLLFPFGLCAQEIPADKTADTIPGYLKNWPGLYIRTPDRTKIIDAPEADQKLGMSYPSVSAKGHFSDGRRITLMTHRLHIRRNDTIHVIHIMEDTLSGRSLYVMGPKKICGEFINDSLVTDSVPKDDLTPWLPLIMNGRILPTPAADYNFDISIYTFPKPGIYRIQWRMGNLVSNELVITVE